MSLTVERTSPTSTPRAPANSTSEEALDRLPHLSLSRWKFRAFRSPPSRMRGRKKHEMPRGVWARVKKPSLIGAEQNHL